MNVGELRAALEGYPQDMLVMFPEQTADYWGTVRALDISTECIDYGMIQLSEHRNEAVVIDEYDYDLDAGETKTVILLG